MFFELERQKFKFRRLSEEGKEHLKMSREEWLSSQALGTIKTREENTHTHTL